jgi:hypothetical protein
MNATQTATSLETELTMPERISALLPRRSGASAIALNAGRRFDLLRKAPTQVGVQSTALGTRVTPIWTTASVDAVLLRLRR